MIPILLALLQTAAPAVPAWTPKEKPEGDGKVSVSASARSTDNNARMVVRCDNVKDPVVSVQFITRTALGGSEDRPVSVAFDGGDPVSSNWEFPGSGAFTRNPAGVTLLTSSLAKAKTVTVTTTDATGAPLTATFAGPGGEAPIVKVLSGCGYVLGQVPAPPAPPPAPVPVP